MRREDGRAIDMAKEGDGSREAIIHSLEQGEFLSLRLTPRGSNSTFDCTLSQNGGDPLRVIYKPARGEAPLWDFPQDTLYKREYAAYLLSEALGWGLVPYSTIRDGPHGIGVVQRYIDHDPRAHYFTLRDQHALDFQRIAVFDIVINNADRKSTHCLRDLAGGIWSIDHGVTFHEQFKLRTVIWDYAGERIPASIISDVQALHKRLTQDVDLPQELGTLLSRREVEALCDRAEALLADPVFPHMDPFRRSYPWPMV